MENSGFTMKDEKYKFIIFVYGLVTMKEAFIYWIERVRSVKSELELLREQRFDKDDDEGWREINKKRMSCSLKRRKERDGRMREWEMSKMFPTKITI